MVGGAVRDAALGLEIGDIDLAVPGDPEPAARTIAAALGGYASSSRPSSRPGGPATAKGPGRSTSPALRGPGIAEDLALRDFTVGAMAVDLEYRRGRWTRTAAWKTWRPARSARSGPTSFSDDPLRLMRAARLAGPVRLADRPGHPRARPGVRRPLAGARRRAHPERAVPADGVAGSGRRPGGDGGPRPVRHPAAGGRRDARCRPGAEPPPRRLRPHGRSSRRGAADRVRAGPFRRGRARARWRNCSTNPWPTGSTARPACGWRRSSTTAPSRPPARRPTASSASVATTGRAPTPCSRSSRG